MTNLIPNTQNLKDRFSSPIIPYPLTSLGFTFIELMVVVGIIGILSGVFATQYPAVQRRSRDTERRNDIKQYQTAMEAFANRSNGNYLAIPGPYIALPAICGTTGLDVSACPEDNQTYRYRAMATTTSYVIWALLEQPPTPDTYFIVCSTGETGERTTPPSSANCPL